jgi:hypothetical protein
LFRNVKKASDAKTAKRSLTPTTHASMQGCQILLDTIYQNGEKIPNYHKICIPNDHKIYRMALN